MEWGFPLLSHPMYYSFFPQGHSTMTLENRIKINAGRAHAADMKQTHSERLADQYQSLGAGFTSPGRWKKGCRDQGHEPPNTPLSSSRTECVVL